MSTQPNVDGGQIRRNQFKLAMAVGKNRHYVVDEILPRHFMQTASAAGVGNAIVDDVLAELAEITPRAVDQGGKALPAGFPGKLFDQITQGILRRLRTITAQQFAGAQRPPLHDPSRGTIERVKPSGRSEHAMHQRSS
jgi:serine/threonine-protein kinase HipA